MDAIETQPNPISTLTSIPSDLEVQGGRYSNDKLSEKGCLLNQFFKAPLNKPIVSPISIHDQEVMNKIKQDKVKMKHK